jgi:hypothetical protein
VGALVVSLCAPAHAAEVELEAALVGTAHFARAHGSAEHETENGHLELDVHLHGLPPRLHGALVTVRVHGTVVGRTRVSAAGRAHLDRHTTVGAQTGDEVRVLSPSGRLVARGAFRIDDD